MIYPNKTPLENHFSYLIGAAGASAYFDRVPSGIAPGQLAQYKVRLHDLRTNQRAGFRTEFRATIRAAGEHTTAALVLGEREAERVLPARI